MAPMGAGEAPAGGYAITVPFVAGDHQFDDWWGGILVDLQGEAAGVTFRVPSYFASSTSLKVCIIPKTTATHRLNAHLNAAPAGSAKTTVANSFGNTDLALTADQVYEWDLTTLLSGINASNQIALRITGEGVNVPDLVVCNLAFVFA